MRHNKGDNTTEKKFQTSTSPVIHFLGSNNK